MASSTLNTYNYEEDPSNENLIDNYFTPKMNKRTSEFYESLSDIVEDRKEFLMYSIEYFYKYYSDENQRDDYFKFIATVVDFTKECLSRIKKDLLNTTENIKITKVQCSLKTNGAIIIFSNNEKIIFTVNSLESEKLFNRIICWVNSKVNKKQKLYVGRLIPCNKCGFKNYIEPLECQSNEELISYYFNSGQLLSILYILNCRMLRDINIVDFCQYPVLQDLTNIFILSEKNLNHSFSSKSIAQDILKFSVYNITFLPKGKKALAKKYIDSIKSGFQYMYNIMVDNKMELIDLVADLFCNNPSYLSTIMTRLYGLNEGDLKRQLYFLDVRFMKKQVKKTLISFSDDQCVNKINKDHLIDLASNLGDHIIQKGIIGFNNFTASRTWISTISSGKIIILSPECYNLYDGNSGIALFFLYLGVITKKDYFINTAVEAMQDSISHINSLNIEREVGIGAFKGISGELYTLSKIYSITKNKNIKEVIEKCICYLDSLIQKETNINVFEGVAGTMAVLLSIYEDKEYSDLKDRMMDLANKAYENIENSIFSKNPISGFYDGNDGVIIVLARLLNITASERIESTIKEILTFERKIKSNGRISSALGWQKEYSGMLLSRLILKKYNFKDDLIDIEIKEALEYTMKNGFGNSPYYYNGDIGNLHILEYAAEILKDPLLKNRCNNTFNILIKKVIEPSINDDVKFGNKPISLMTGLTGQGYSLIRKCNEDVVPEVLWLQ